MVGTAVTVEAIDASGKFLGGIILSGHGIMLRAHDDSDAALAGIRAALQAREKSQATAGGAKSGQTIFAMVDFLASGTNDRQAEALRKLIDLLSRKKALASRVARDIQYQALMEIWLYFHVPLSFATVAALFAHVVSVFFYW